MKIRVLVGLIIFVSMFLLPWWTTLSVMVVAMITFPIFYESIALAFLYDLVYGIPGFEPTPFFSTLMVLATLIVVENIREMVIFDR